MKKIVSTFVLLTSLTASTQDFKSLVVKNLTYPDKQMVINCLDENCSEIEARGLVKQYTHRLSMNDIEQTIYNRGGRGGDNELYSLTSDASDNVSRSYKEAYYGKAVGNSVLTGGAFVVDTVIAIPQLIIKAFSSKRDSVSDKKGAKRLKANLLSNLDEILIKEKYYAQINSYLRRKGQWVELPTQQEIEENEEIMIANSTYKGPVFRCQLTVNNCKENGGRYGKKIEAVDYLDAINSCKRIAASRDQKFCRLTSPLLD